MKRISGIILFFIVACLALLWASTAAAQPSGPVLRYGNRLRVYVGPTEPLGARIFVGTTWSVSPNADIGPPFDQTGENANITHWSKSVRVIAPNDPCLVEPALNLPCRDTGWVDLPVPDVRIEVPLGSGVWVSDVDMRIVIHVTEMKYGGCSVAACGARLVVPRMKLSEVLEMPTGAYRRREVIH